MPVAPPQVAAVDAHHSAIGKAARFLFGAPTIDSETGEAIPQRPGQLFRSLLAGALLGGAIGSENPRGGFLGGLARGGAGVEQQNYQRAQQAQAQRQRHQQLDLEQSRFEEEKSMHRARWKSGTWRI